MAAAPPVNPEAARLVSRYGVRPSRATGAPHFHAGIDIATGRRNEPVYAIKGGTVALVGVNQPGGSMGGYGNAVVIDHGNGIYVLYAHLKDGSVTVAQGQRVEAGTRIGIIGNTTNGRFSPLPGQSVEDWTRQARARGYGSGPMVPHLHMEVRQAYPDGRAPFPGPYPQTPEQAGQNRDPAVWLRESGLAFRSRGGFDIIQGGAADRGRGRTWGRVAPVAGLGAVVPWSDGQAPLVDCVSRGEEFARANSHLFGRLGQYQPPVFERDVAWGLTPTEWALLGGGIALTGAVGAIFIMRRRVTANRGPRKNRLRRWGER